MLYLNHIGIHFYSANIKKSYFAANCDVVYLGPSHGLIIICNTISSNVKYSPSVTLAGPITGLGRCGERATIVML